MTVDIGICALFGLLIGSFLNVCVYRVPRRLSVVTPARSFCPTCERQLTWWENVPVITWLILLGRCSCRKGKVSGVYPLVEILSSFAAVWSYLRFGFTPTGVLAFIFAATLIVITFIDFEHRIIPDRISYPGMSIGLLIGGLVELGAFHLVAPPFTSGTFDSLLGFAIGGGFFNVVSYVYWRMTGDMGLGGGDVKLLAFTGALLGWESVPFTIFLGSLLGSVVGITLISLRGGGRKTEIAFGPYLSIAALLYVFSDIPFFRF